jgi:hypothetical protein
MIVATVLRTLWSFTLGTPAVMSVTGNLLQIQLDLTTWRPAVDPRLTGERPWHFELTSAQ